MKYLLIEHGDGATLTICDTPELREAATIEAIFGNVDAANEPEYRDEANGYLELLRDSYRLDFEGDPPLEWLDAAEVKNRSS